MTKVLCVGIATLDHVYAVDTMPDRPEKFRARDLVIIGGGTAATAAFAVARLGGQAMLAARLGDDMTGRVILAELEEAGVDCSLARRYPGRRSPSSAVLVDPQGERLVMCYADARLPEDASFLPERLPADIRAVLGDVSWIAGARRLFAAARLAGIPSLIDGDRVIEDLGYFDAASHVAYSAATVRQLTGISDPAEGLAALARAAGNWIAVTDGGRGAWFTEDGAIDHEPGFAVAAVDTLGAGDVFHGALALALAEGRPERLAVRFANAAAALKCTRFGGGRAGAPSRDEVEAFMRRAN
ncbi:sulfofructose kinase [Rhizobiales bacterium GAS188]|nr:sulfofructose kinase [Rhizobiales bacterium GAS188]